MCVAISLTSPFFGNSQYCSQSLRREYGVWERVEHPNVLHLEGLFISDLLPSPGLVSEYKEHGDLLAFMHTKVEFDRLAMVR